MITFYHPDPESNPRLEDEEFNHCIRVLRKTVGDEIILFDGRGKRYAAIIRTIHKHACEFEISSSEGLDAKPFSCHLAIAPTKNTERMEWLVEKAGELSIDQISLIETARSERPRIKLDRLEKKAISAMKQSGSGFKLTISPMIPFDQWITSVKVPHKFIAVVEKDLTYLAELLPAHQDICILVGPEGDFTPGEVAQAEAHGFQKVSLGATVLRTETAGLIACHFVNVVNGF